ncbi:MAG: FMN-binding protein [Spirochaetales bacterium]|jgi:Na+-transporting NADH:ubiquinone oxidoreductase subunit C|nr:FMN-binding protein [Spirochaetales bacterium]
MKVQSAFYRDRIYPLLFMFLTTFFCILLTAGIHLTTLDRANANELSFARKAVLDAAGIAYVNTTAGIEEAYLKSIEEADGYFTTSSPDGKRFIIPLEGPGLWGTISLMVGFEEDLQTFAGVAIVSQNETPGLGARIEEPWFTTQFEGKQAPFTLVEEGTATAENEVDAITGATRTSEYFRNLANQASDAAKSIVGGE